MTKRLRLEPTPLQKVLGFEVAEEIYDMLPLRAQLIIDLKIEGYTTREIAQALDIGQMTVQDTFIKARHSLLRSKMHLILESRVHYRETHEQVLESD